MPRVSFREPLVREERRRLLPARPIDFRCTIMQEGKESARACLEVDAGTPRDWDAIEAKFAAAHGKEPIKIEELIPSQKKRKKERLHNWMTKVENEELRRERKEMEAKMERMRDEIEYERTRRRRAERSIDSCQREIEDERAMKEEYMLKYDKRKKELEKKEDECRRIRKDLKTEQRSFEAWRDRSVKAARKFTEVAEGEGGQVPSVSPCPAPTTQEPSYVQYFYSPPTYAPEDLGWLVGQSGSELGPDGTFGPAQSS